MADSIFEIKAIRSPQELEQAFAIRRRVFVEEQHVPAEIEWDEFEKTSVHFLLSLRQKPIATGRLRSAESKLKFERIATLPEHRGQGAGRALMLFMQRYADLHFPGMPAYMHAQEEAVAFYEKFGWVCEGQRFFEAEIAHRKMLRLTGCPN